MGCGVRISDRVSGCVKSSIEAGSTRTVCWQGDAASASIVRVKFRPLYFLVCNPSVSRSKQKHVETRGGDRSEENGGNTQLLS
jgi:hypothetical protein